MVSHNFRQILLGDSTKCQKKCAVLHQQINLTSPLIYPYYDVTRLMFSDTLYSLYYQFHLREKNITTTPPPLTRVAIGAKKKDIILKIMGRGLSGKFAYKGFLSGNKVKGISVLTLIPHISNCNHPFFFTHNYLNFLNQITFEL